MEAISSASNTDFEHLQLIFSNDQPLRRENPSLQLQTAVEGKFELIMSLVSVDEANIDRFVLFFIHKSL